MRVLMFGWEFPPHISGGLGTACFGLTRALTRRGTEVVFVIPKVKAGAAQSHVKLVSAAHVQIRAAAARKALRRFLKAHEVRTIDSLLRPYLSAPEYRMLLRRTLRAAAESASPAAAERSVMDISGEYGPNLVAEVVRYAEAAELLAASEEFDVIHAHDWMTVLAGVRAKKISGKPLVFHVHALEFDRSGENVNTDIYRIEKMGMEVADRVIAVSHYTRNIIIQRYGIPEEKITVVHNAVSRRKAGALYGARKPSGEKLVTFLGRVTFQKGPDYFVEAAGRVLQQVPGTRFVMAGSGDMLPRMVRRVAELRMGSSFHFTGFLGGSDVERIFAMSDVYVMPSVSEPFGISPLEAMLYDVPVIVSKQSGVAEVIRHALKVDFWDVREIANKIIAVLRYPAMVQEMVRNCRHEMRTIQWGAAAEKVEAVYHALCHC